MGKLVDLPKIISKATDFYLLILSVDDSTLISHHIIMKLSMMGQQYYKWCFIWQSQEFMLYIERGDEKIKYY